MSEVYSAKFAVGQVIHHNKFDYRGVIIDVDPVFSATDEWYEKVARSRPPKDKPWYHVLVENSLTQSYVAERHLEVDESLKPIKNPAINIFFSSFKNGIYFNEKALN